MPGAFLSKRLNYPADFVRSADAALPPHFDQSGFTRRLPQFPLQLSDPGLFPQPPVASNPQPLPQPLVAWPSPRSGVQILEPRREGFDGAEAVSLPHDS